MQWNHLAVARRVASQLAGADCPDHVGKADLFGSCGALAHFAIAGEDMKWVWADARIDGDTVIVRSPEVAKPRAVRYAFAMNPAKANLSVLLNSEGRNDEAEALLRDMVANHPDMRDAVVLVDRSKSDVANPGKYPLVFEIEPLSGQPQPQKCPG